MAPQHKLGEILVAAGVVDEFQLRSALGEQQRWGGRLGITLIKLGFLEERDLVRALASQMGLPVAHIEGKRVETEVLAHVPVDVAERSMCLPLFVKEEAGVSNLFLAMEDPCDLQVMDEIRFRTGMVVRPVLMGPSEICEGIDRFYHRTSSADGPDLLSPPAPTAAPPVPVAPVDDDETAPLQLDVPTPAPKPDTSGEASTRLILRALCELLEEKGLVGRSELVDRVRALHAADARGD